MDETQGLRLYKGEYMNTPAIKTERLILRKFTENDLEAIYTIYGDEEISLFLPWFPLKTMETVRDALSILL